MPESPQEPKEIDFPNWNDLSENQKNLLTKHIIQAKRWRFALFSLLTLIMTGQPILSSYYSNQNEERKAQNLRTEMATQSNKALNDSILQTVLELQKKLAVLEKEKSKLEEEKSSLEKRVANLEAQLLE